MRHLSTAALAALGLVVGLSGASANAASLIHSYELNGSLADSIGGPSLVSAGGTLGSSTYNFGANQGLSLSNALPNAGSYSIETSFEFDATSGYRKIIDFKNQTSDNGLYNINGHLQFYNIPAGSDVVFSNAQSPLAHLVLTRDGAGTVTGYINGVQEISFADSSSIGTFSAANSIIQFFKDDTVTGSEASAGSVNFIRIYDGALSSAEVAALEPAAAAPLPNAAWAGLGLMGVALVGKARRRKLA